MKRLIFILVAVAALLVGCGGPDAEEKYVKAVNDAQDSAGKAIAEAGREITGTTTPEQDAAAVGRQADAVRDLADHLTRIPRSDTERDVVVPEGLEDEHNVLIDQLAALAAAIRDSVESPTAAQELELAQKRVGEAIREINEELSA